MLASLLAAVGPPLVSNSPPGQVFEGLKPLDSYPFTEDPIGIGLHVCLYASPDKLV